MDPEDILSYSISGKKLCYIINNENFVSTSGLPDRTGTKNDVENLKNLFEKLNFEVKTHRNVNCANIKKNLENISRRKDLKDYSMFVCIILSYGDENVIYGTDDGSVKIDQLLKNFRGDQCEGLRGKPKLFFIQACRVKRKGHQTDSNEDNVVNRIPIEADVLIGLSTVPGRLSWGDGTNSGSWYIQALCRALEESGNTEDILHILLQVNALVAEQLQFYSGDFQISKVQIPNFTCMLRKKLYLGE